MTTYLWYSRSSQESASIIAKELDIPCGSLPPTDFSGTLICWGAKPSDKFKWGSRTLRAIFNDPRNVRTYLDRKVLFDKLAEAGINVASCITLDEDSQYLNLCNLLGVTAEDGFITGRPTGRSARVVTNQAELHAAVVDGNVRAFDPKFVQANRIRLYVVNGSVVGATTRATAAANDTFFTRAIEEVTAAAGVGVGNAEMALRKAVELGIVKPIKGYWSAFGAVTPVMRTTAILAAQTLGMEFCAVDISSDGVDMQVLNVVTTPNLREVPSVHAALVTAIGAWNTDNSRTTKEVLQDLVNDATDEEAVALLEKLREFKGELTDTAAG